MAGQNPYNQGAYRQGFEQQNHGQPGHGQPYGNDYQYVVVKPHRGPLLLTLALIGFFFGCPIATLASADMASSDIKELKAGVMDRQGKGLTVAAYWISIVHLIMIAVLFASSIFLFTVMATSGR